jgi:acetoin utilization protein AcuC
VNFATDSTPNGRIRPPHRTPPASILSMDAQAQPRPADDPLVVIWDDSLGMRWPGEHPMDGRRHQLCVALLDASGALAQPAIRLEPAPGPLSDDRLAQIFAPAFVSAMRRFSANPLLGSGLDAKQWGIGGDNGAYPEMHADAAHLAGAAAEVAERVASGVATRTFLPGGGSHHGTANRASGFGVYNETAVSVAAAKAAGAERIAYIDLDVHHGDGTQWMFYEDPNVLTVSVHESGKHLFPGSGFAGETGGPGAEGSAANVPLPPFSSDEEWLSAIDQVVLPVVRAYRPDILITQCGVDHHHADPLSHHRTTMALYPQIWERLDELSIETTDGRWVAHGGGGYYFCGAAPRAWALLAARMAGLRVGDPLPDAWRDMAAAMGCESPPARWLEDEPPDADEAELASARTGTAESIVRTRAALAMVGALS